MVRRVLAGLCVCFMCIFVTSCGQTYQLQSIAVTPANGYVLTSAAPTGQLTVTATYSNTKTNDVTGKSSYEVGDSGLNSTTAPQGVVTINDSGLVAATGPLACTYAPTTFLPNPYPVSVTYSENGVTVHATVSINVQTLSPCGGK